MTKNFNTNTDNNDEWLTPPALITALGTFDLDPCAPSDERRPWDTATRHISLPEDGLTAEWLHSERVWLNPPYGKHTFAWMNRLAHHEGGGVGLIFARTETHGFHEQIWNKARCVYFFRGRLAFHTVSGTKGNTANAPSCLVAYTEADAMSICNAHDAGLLRGYPVFM